MDFQQSKTFQNVQNAFIGESITSTKYAIYGKKAVEEQYIQIGNVYQIISGIEREHAIIWLKLLNNGTIPNTLTNLEESTNIEVVRGNNVYREYANVAREEGFDHIAALFEGIANIELIHESTFHTFYSNIQNGEVFCKPEENLWMCLNCGNVLGGNCAPKICPICGYPQGFYQVYIPQV